MFDETSRYFGLETTTATLPDGRVVSFKRRRFLPHPEDLPILTVVTVVQGDRLDLVTARTLGDPEQFWRICDANSALDPASLTSEPGRALRVPAPRP
jgi:hypothetical protein